MACVWTKNGLYSWDQHGVYQAHNVLYPEDQVGLPLCMTHTNGSEWHVFGDHHGLCSGDPNCLCSWHCEGNNNHPPLIKCQPMVKGVSGI